MNATTYRSLLVTYPRSWRERNGQVVLDTLLTVHGETGRSRPNVAERTRFALDGLRVRFTRLRQPHPRAVAAGVLSSIHFLDQTNGVLPPEAVTDELSQIRANSSELRNTADQRCAAVAAAGMNALGR